MLNQHPITGPVKLVNIYGVILWYNQEKQEVYIMDETKESFALSVNLVYNSSLDKKKNRKPEQKNRGLTKKEVIKRMHLRSGDIIRVHRLMLQKDFTRKSIKASDLVVCKDKKSVDKDFISDTFTSRLLTLSRMTLFVRSTYPLIQHLPLLTECESKN